MKIKSSKEANRSLAPKILNGILPKLSKVTPSYFRFHKFQSRYNLESSTIVS